MIEAWLDTEHTTTPVCGWDDCWDHSAVVVIDEWGDDVGTAESFTGRFLCLPHWEEWKRGQDRDQ